MSFILKTKKIKLTSYPELLIYSCDYDNSSFSQAEYERLDVKFLEHLERAVDKRKSEFLAGRYIAKKTLNDLGLADVDIPVGENRSPVWPAGIVASISHTKTKAFCAASMNSVYSKVGIDIEDVMSLKTAGNIKSSIISESEEVYLRTLELDFIQALTLVFSAKESLFKALYPTVKKYFGFSAAEVVEISLSKQFFKLRLCESLEQTLAIDRIFHGWFSCNDTEILTLIAE